MGRVEIRAYHAQNFHTTIVIKLVSIWLRSRNYMDDSVEHHCSRVKLEKARYLVQK
jgi:hypothetical protein